MNRYLQSVKNAYQQRNSFILIALTGRTGSGCSTTASILGRKSFQEIDLYTPKDKEFNSVEERKYAIIHKYMENEHWSPFAVIEGSSVIFSFVIEHGLEELREYFEGFKERNENNQIRISSFASLIERIKGMKHFFTKSELCKLNEFVDQISSSDVETVNAYYNFYLKELPLLKREFEKILKGYTCHEEYEDRFSQTEYKKASLYTFFMQQIGNNIRSSGNPYSKNYTEDNFYQVAQRIDQIIKIIRRFNELHRIPNTRICIDAVRNPYEAFYFKDIYSSFYLISVNTEEDERKRRLNHLDAEELASLDETEDPRSFNENCEMFFHQNISGCLEIADIHLYNPRVKSGKFYFLTEQLTKYICLMIHPGLVTPSNIERCMQLAYNAKLNSGCLSRQVGAIITDKHFSVKAVGWNDVPAGQIPCNLRDTCTYCLNRDTESYSEFEIENHEFADDLNALRTQIEETELDGRFFPYCFKDVYYGITGQKNQVHTRSLHAEENSFLQLAKYGGQGINGGILFTTASPCELCSKKAYQLGIKDIYYIDPYPGISFSHVLKFGKYNNPTPHLFYGAIGNAYVALYTQRISVKDELELMTGISAKNAKKYSKDKPLGPLTRKDVKYLEKASELVFETRDKIYAKDYVKLHALHDDIKAFTDSVYWTGSSFDGISLLQFESENEERTVHFKFLQERSQPYTCVLTMSSPLSKDEVCEIITRIDVKDSSRIMSPYYAHIVEIETEISVIKVTAPIDLLKDVYADKKMSKEWQVSKERIIPEEKIIDGCRCEVYSITQEKPNLNYSYCIEWNFIT